MKNPKNKGSSFERYISKKLSLWLTNQERDDCFWRTSNSGGRFTERNKKNKITENQEGDIGSTSTKTSFFTNIFHIECKSYKDINLWSLITKQGNLYHWCCKYLEEAHKNTKHLLLIVKQNNKPELIIIENNFLNVFDIDPILTMNELDLFIVKFSDFLNINVKKLMKNGLYYIY